MNEYNDAARALVPPRPTVDWDKVSHYSFIEEFSLLQDTRNDIRSRTWARPEVREAIRTSKRIRRAQEEIQNCNREVRRVHTWIRDEELLFREVLARLKAERNELYPAVLDYCRHRRAANARNMAYIERIYGLLGFSGQKIPGLRVGAPRAKEAAGTHPDGGSESDALAVDDTIDLDLDEDEEPNEEVAAIVEYMGRLTT